MSVTQKSDMDLRIGCRLEAGCRSESYKVDVVELLSREEQKFDSSKI